MGRKIADITFIILLSSYHSKPTDNSSSILHVTTHIQHSDDVTNKTHKAEKKLEIPCK
jgi:hypothetical protein